MVVRIDTETRGIRCVLAYDYPSRGVCISGQDYRTTPNHCGPVARFFKAKDHFTTLRPGFGVLS